MFPIDVKIFIDTQDATKWIFGQDVVTLTEVNKQWHDIDISSFIRGPGMHKIEITCADGVGRVEARLEIG